MFLFFQILLARVESVSREIMEQFRLPKWVPSALTGLLYCSQQPCIHFYIWPIMGQSQTLPHPPHSDIQRVFPPGSPPRLLPSEANLLQGVSARHLNFIPHQEMEQAMVSVCLWVCALGGKLSGFPSSSPLGAKLG